MTQVASQNQSVRNDAIGVAGYALNNSVGGTTNGIVGWGGYFQCDNNPNGAVSTSCFGIEIDTVNYYSNFTADPYQHTNGGSFNLWVAAGGAQNPTYPSNAAMVILKNGTTFNSGIIMTSTALTQDASGNQTAVALPSGAMIEWFTASSTPAGILSSNAAGTIRLGALDAASPVAQKLLAQSVVAGNANTAGATFTIGGSKSNGSGGGDIVLQTTLSSASSGVQNTLATALTLKGGTQQAIFAGPIQITSLQSGTPATYACFDSGGNLISSVSAC